MLIWAYISSTLVKCVLSANVDEKQPNKLIEVWLLKQGHCTEYVTGVSVAIEILELKNRSYKYSWNPGLSKGCFAGKEAKEGKESDFIVLKITYEMEILLSFQVMLVQRDLAMSFAWGRSVGCSKTYSKFYSNVHLCNRLPLKAGDCYCCSGTFVQLHPSVFYFIIDNGTVV